MMEPVMNPGFWEVHGLIFGLLFLFFITVLPRVTLLVATPWGGLLWWLGLFFLPRLTVAVVATMIYGDTNPVLVAIAWIIAVTGELAEKFAVGKQAKKPKKQKVIDIKRRD